MSNENIGSKVTAPWSLEQVDALNAYQHSGQFHPFTCGNRGDGKHVQRDGEDLGQLIATPEGWRCHDCGYRQGWAHKFMEQYPG